MPFENQNKLINLLIDPNPTTFINLEKIKPKTAEMIKVDKNTYKE